MRKLVSFFAFALLFTLNTGKTQSYVFSTISTGTTLRWNLSNPASPIVRNGRVVYNLNPAGSADVPFAQVEAALADSFRAWEDLPNCTIAFTRGENRTETGSGNDGIFQIYWNENSTVDDGLDISGALAVTRMSILAGGNRDGEISDASMVFNGNQYQWATDGNGSRVDIAEVATHEIGHALGLSHSPIGAATMFPRTGNGSLRNRTLHSDDQIGASANYPASGFLSANGTLRGFVRDQSGAALFGANVALTDTNGNVIATALTQRDGSYRIQGVPPGNYTAFAEPIDSAGGLFFGVSDLGSFYSSANTDFLTSTDVNVSLNAGSETARDFSVNRGTPAFNAQLVYQPVSRGLTNMGATVERGQTVTIGVGGPGIPTSAVAFSVSGPGITVTNVRAGTLSGSAGGYVIGDAIINADAIPGARNLIVTANGQRSVVTGGLEITGSASSSAVSVVSAADFKTSLAPESIAAAFGTNLATSRATAITTPLPTTLGGTTVRLRDSAGTALNAPLFFVSPTQINYQLPPGLQTGAVTITITNSAGQVSTGTLQLSSVAPGLFSMLGNGAGPAAASVLRIKPNGAQSFEPAIRLDTATGRYVTVPIDLSNMTDQVYLILFGTGFRFRSSLISVGVTVGGLSQSVQYAGKQGGQVGLDQLNVLLNRNGLTGRGEVDVSATVDGRVSNTVRVNIK